jgi:hypothetical protein
VLTPTFTIAAPLIPQQFMSESLDEGWKSIMRRAGDLTFASHPKSTLYDSLHSTLEVIGWLQNRQRR